MEHLNQYADLDAALQRLRGDKKIYGQMLVLFLTSKEFSALEESLAAGDYEKSAQLAHTIKGVTGNLSLTLLFDTSTALLNELRDGIYQEVTLSSYRDALVKTRAYLEEELIPQLAMEIE